MIKETGLTNLNLGTYSKLSKDKCKRHNLVSFEQILTVCLMAFGTSVRHIRLKCLRREKTFVERQQFEKI